MDQKRSRRKNLNLPFDPVREFLRLEAAGGIVLVGAAALALVVANSPISHGYEHLVETPLAVRIGEIELAKPLLLWINEGLMAVFFLLVGLEIKREVVDGALSSVARAAQPLVAALAGMAVPAAIYAAFAHGDPESLRGWAIPSATDIAFSLGVLSLLGSRVPVGLKVFLMAVAVFDDLGSIVVIAIFYAEHLSTTALVLSCFPLAGLAAMNLSGVRRLGPYVVVGIALWLCVLESGVHATLSGVATALAIPRTAGDVLARRLHPWVAFGILPVFAFANAGISLAGVGWETLTAPVMLGIAFGLFAGKQLGIFAAVFAMVRLRLAPLPEGATWGTVYGVALLAGIGFTMSLFIGTLAFSDMARAVDVRLGVMLGSLASAVCGYVVLKWQSKPSV